MNEDPVIRPFRPEDWPAVEDIVRRIWDIGLAYVRERRYGRRIADRPWQDHKIPDVREELFAEPEHAFVSELDGRVIGFCCYRLDASGGIGEVGQNGVHPDFRGQGYGARQLAFVLEELRRAGMTIAEVQTGLNDGHAPARRMYERVGFEPLIGYQRYCLDLRTSDTL